MPHAEINVPGLILVGRFSGDPHWPVLGDPWGAKIHQYAVSTIARNPGSFNAASSLLKATSSMNPVRAVSGSFGGKVGTSATSRGRVSNPILNETSILRKNHVRG
jgi:hypothetical protein